MKCFLLLIFFVVHVERWLADKIDSSLCRLKLGEAIWLVGETPITGFSNQLCSVFSYIPLAQLLGSNLILGEMYSRKNFEIKMRQYDREKDAKIVLSFEDFFNFRWFKEFWSREKLKVYLVNDFSSCFLYANLEKTKFIQRKKWRSATKSELLDMINLSHVSLPPEAGTIFRFKSKFKMMALYNFGSDKSDLLFKILDSIRPSLKVMNAIDLIMKSLPTKFIAVHLRIEADVIFYDRNSSEAFLHEDTHFLASLPTIIGTIMNSICLRQFNSSSYALYIASGAFNGKGLLLSRNREQVMRSALKEKGFDAIYSSSDFLSASPYESFHAEILAYVDLEIARRSICFIPAHVPSSFSYLAQRVRELDKGILETHIPAPNRRYSSFFF